MGSVKINSLFCNILCFSATYEVKGGGMKEIEPLSSDYKDDVFRYLYTLTHDTSLSEDLMQDAFVEAILHIHYNNR